MKTGTVAGIAAATLAAGLYLHFEGSPFSEHTKTPADAQQTVAAAGRLAFTALQDMEGATCRLDRQHSCDGYAYEKLPGGTRNELYFTVSPEEIMVGFMTARTYSGPGAGMYEDRAWFAVDLPADTKLKDFKPGTKLTPEKLESVLTQKGVELETAEAIFNLRDGSGKYHAFGVDRRGAGFRRYDSTDPTRRLTYPNKASAKQVTRLATMVKGIMKHAHSTATA